MLAAVLQQLPTQGANQGAAAAVLRQPSSHLRHGLGRRYTGGRVSGSQSHVASVVALFRVCGSCRVLERSPQISLTPSVTRSPCIVEREEQRRAALVNCQIISSQILEITTPALVPQVLASPGPDHLRHLRHRRPRATAWALVLPDHRRGLPVRARRIALMPR